MIFGTGPQEVNGSLLANYKVFLFQIDDIRSPVCTSKSLNKEGLHRGFQVEKSFSLSVSLALHHFQQLPCLPMTLLSAKKVGWEIHTFSITFKTS